MPQPGTHARANAFGETTAHSRRGAAGAHIVSALACVCVATHARAVALCCEEGQTKQPPPLGVLCPPAAPRGRAVDS